MPQGAAATGGRVFVARACAEAPDPLAHRRDPSIWNEVGALAYSDRIVPNEPGPRQLALAPRVRNDRCTLVRRLLPLVSALTLGVAVLLGIVGLAANRFSANAARSMTSATHYFDSTVVLARAAAPCAAFVATSSRFAFGLSRSACASDWAARSGWCMKRSSIPRLGACLPESSGGGAPRPTPARRARTSSTRRRSRGSDPGLRVGTVRPVPHTSHSSSALTSLGVGPTRRRACRAPRLLHRSCQGRHLVIGGEHRRPRPRLSFAIVPSPEADVR